ncbi:ATP-binding cassette domain-containing protein [Acuticoccus sp. I52.16.1]|uniref:ATP-binding cassette domain-containing protein n=1 Tax=Acuticoccus sp. I52.16.1 TaxID=2928472 RepID=UPI001FD3A49C|nr:ATP-binding cassette domain-containing protein [Acuticoccus sp. I52.16.1]UOM37275.1 ATP-binding cassette domain-containing protein [Acuticoccus sp. I52.16.1]
MSRPLRLTGLVAGYERDLPIVRGVDLAVAAGAFVGIFGPNGAGKSTLVKAVAGAAATFAGEAWLGDTRLTGHPAHEVLAAGLAFVPQTENIFATLSIAENLKIAAQILPRAVRAERIEAMNAMFPDLAARPHRAAGSLSGGQRQMLAVARALIVAPAAIILDEPSAGLSPKLTQDVFATLREINAAGTTVVLVEQNVRAALGVVSRGVVLVDGKVRLDAPAADLAARDDLGALFLGTAAA